jgi:protein-tyrosine phosphatase
MRNFRRMLSRMRHLPDQLLHAQRHRRARALVAGWPTRRVLVVCLGNICRSPYAAAALRSAAGAHVEIESAGFIGPGRAVPGLARDLAARSGLDLSAHRSRQLSADMVSAADLVVVMDVTQRRMLRQRYGNALRTVLLGDLDPKRVEKRTVRDPYQQSEAVFEEVFRRIDRCVSVLASELTPCRPGSRHPARSAGS